MPVTVRGTDILFNDGTTQSTAAPPAVPSSYGAVGTVIIGLVQLTTLNAVISEGTTFAGSSLRRTPDSANNGNRVDTLNWGFEFNEFQTFNPISFWGSAVTLSLSGTWRTLTRLKNANANYTAGTLAGAVLLQRIS